MKIFSCLFGLAVLVIASSCSESKKTTPSEIVKEESVTLPNGQKATQVTFVTEDGQQGTMLMGQTGIVSKGGTNSVAAVVHVRSVSVSPGTNDAHLKK